MRKITISKREEGQRFDKFLKKYLSNANSGFIYKMLRKKNIILNDAKASGNELIREGDEVKIFFSEETFDKFSAEQKSNMPAVHIECRDNCIIAGKYKIDILYEDEETIFFNKPAGLLSQKALKNDVSLSEIFVEYMRIKYTGEETKGYSPGICNRLDRNTSGIIAAGKSVLGQKKLSETIRSHTVRKFYRCIVFGKVNEAGHLKGYLVKDEKTNKVRVISKNEYADDAWYIETIYTPIEVNDKYSLLEVELVTGKTHQIRAHLESIGHPILGDAKYGRKTDLMPPRQMLHAYEMRFDDKTITAPLPEDFERVYKDAILEFKRS